MSAAAFKKRVGRLIRSAREAAGLRQDDVAARVGETVTKSLLSRYETGAVLPRIERLRALLGACGVRSVPPAIEAGYRAVAHEVPDGYGQVIATEAAKEFVAAWVEYRSLDRVAEVLGMHRLQVRWYASRLRRKGVKLPRARRKDVDAREDFQALRDFLDEKLNEEEGG